MNYQQAYDKIIQAYFNNEIKPFEERFCFCGTLSPNANWARCEFLSDPILPHYPYTVEEYARMEKALFSKMKKVEWVEVGIAHYPENEPYTEDELFAGMSAALDVLKEIHRSRGEDVDAITVPFTKRQLA